VRFLLDQDVYALTAAYLRFLGHDVLTAAQLGLSRSPDDQLIEMVAIGSAGCPTERDDLGC
jgi:hypothetical protein